MASQSTMELRAFALDGNDKDGLDAIAKLNDVTALVDIATNSQHPNRRIAAITKLASFALYDPNTGLLNQTAIEQRIMEEIERSSRTEKPATIVILSADLQKNGRIKELLRIVNENKRGYDVLGRVGDNELVLLLPETNIFSAYEVIERIKTKFEQNFVSHDGVRNELTISAGIISTEESQDVNYLISKVREAKETTQGNSVCVYLCGAMLSDQEVSGVRANAPLLSVIRKHRQGIVTVRRSGQVIPIAQLVKENPSIIAGHVKGKGDFNIDTPEDPSAAFTGFVFGPGVESAVRNPVRDTGAQILEQLRNAGYQVFPEGSEIWLTGPAIPNFFNVLLSHACCMNCTYCTQQHNQRTVLEGAQVRKIMEEITANGQRKGIIFSLTGGEPLMPLTRDNIYSLLERARQLSMFSTMNTNAMLISSEVAASLVAAGIGALNVSLDSFDPFTENRIIRVDAYGKIIDGLKAISNARKLAGESCSLKRVTLNHVLTLENFRQLPNFIERMCRLREQFPGLFDDINPLPVKEAPHLYLKLEHIEEFTRVILPRVLYLARHYNLKLLRAKASEIFGSNIADEHKRRERSYLATQGIYYDLGDMLRLPCATAMTSLTVDPNGSVYPCTYHRESKEGTKGRIVIGNVHSGNTVRQMQTDYFEILRRLPRTLSGGINPICQNICGPDLKRLNNGVLGHLRGVGVWKH